MTRDLIAEEWDGFRENVVEKGIPDREMTSLRTTFYAGAYIVHRLLYRKTTTAAEREAIGVELKAFFARRSNGWTQ